MQARVDVYAGRDLALINILSKGGTIREQERIQIVS